MNTTLHLLRRTGAASLALAAFLGGTLAARAQEIPGEPSGNPVETPDLPIEQAILTSPPHVPPPITRRHPARVVVQLEVREVVQRLADGVDYTFWTFGGTVPGSFIRVRQGDVVEFHLNNHPSSKMPHNIDLHAVTGPGGGAAATFTAPGHSSQFTFTAEKSGLFVYHCATAPVPMHVANGMYGLILVEPPEGLPPVDREYYVMQGEVYTTGRNGEPGLQSFDPEKAEDERAPYVVFNGAVGSLTGDNALTADVGNRVRLYFGVGGPNLTSSFHVIGEIFDTVYPESAFSNPQHNIQTTLVPTGGSVTVEFKLQVPGTYVLVDHSLSRAFNKGALAMLKVAGTADRVLYSGKEIDSVYTGRPAPANFAAASKSERPRADAAKPLAAATPAATASASSTASSPTKALQIERGQKVFATSCFACHQQNGQGLPGIFPPLAQSDFLQANKERAIHAIAKGLSGPITVNGKPFNNIMPPQQFSDQELADALTYVMNSWGNDFGTVSADEVKAVRTGATTVATTP
jgi:nitrite reductase (NO-forming)